MLLFKLLWECFAFIYLPVSLSQLTFAMFFFSPSNLPARQPLLHMFRGCCYTSFHSDLSSQLPYKAVYLFPLPSPLYLGAVSLPNMFIFSQLEPIFSLQVNLFVSSHPPRIPSLISLSPTSFSSSTVLILFPLSFPSYTFLILLLSLPCLAFPSSPASFFLTSSHHLSLASPSRSSNH